MLLSVFLDDSKMINLAHILTNMAADFLIKKWLFTDLN